MIDWSRVASGYVRMNSLTYTLRNTVTVFRRPDREVRRASLRRDQFQSSTPRLSTDKQTRLWKQMPQEDAWIIIQRTNMFGNRPISTTDVKSPFFLLLSTVNARKLSWFGHVCGHDTLPDIILQGTKEQWMAVIKTGRPRKSWKGKHHEMDDRGRWTPITVERHPSEYRNDA